MKYVLGETFDINQNWKMPRKILPKGKKARMLLLSPYWRCANIMKKDENV